MLHLFVFSVLLSVLGVSSNPIEMRQTQPFVDCLNKVSNLQVFTSGSSSWNNLISPYNKRYNGKFIPRAVVQPSTYDAVSGAVKCASNAGVRVSPRSGGHSYVAGGLGSRNGSLVVDLARLSSISIDQSGVGVVQAGARLGDMALVFGNAGRAMSHGTCITVGVGGHIGAGGFGQTSRAWGLALDHVIGAKVVLASGEIATANSNTNSDLFWGLRGASTSFGIVVEYTVQTEVAPKDNVHFAYTYYPHSKDAWNKILLAFQDFSINKAPSSLTWDANIFSGPTIELNGQWMGTSAQLNKTLKPLLDIIGQPSETKYEVRDWIGVLESVGGVSSLNTSLSKHPSDTFQETSLMIPNGSPITTAAFSAFYDVITKSDTSQLSWFAQIELYGGNGSFINSIPVDSTAFAYRDTLWTLQLYASSKNYSPPYPQSGFTFVKAMENAFRNNMNTNFRAYTNYIDAFQDGWQKLYYGTHVDKLKSLQKVYDPTKLFTKPQIIGNGTNYAPDI